MSLVEQSYFTEVQEHLKKAIESETPEGAVANIDKAVGILCEQLTEDQQDHQVSMGYIRRALEEGLKRRNLST